MLRPPILRGLQVLMIVYFWASPLMAAAPPLKLGQNIQRKTVPTMENMSLV